MIIEVFLWVIWPCVCLVLAKKIGLVGKFNDLLNTTLGTINTISSVGLSDEEKQKFIISYGLKMVAQASILSAVLAGFLIPYGVWYVLL